MRPYTYIHTYIHTGGGESDEHCLKLLVYMCMRPYTYICMRPYTYIHTYIPTYIQAAANLMSTASFIPASAGAEVHPN